MSSAKITLLALLSIIYLPAAISCGSQARPVVIKPSWINMAPSDSMNFYAVGYTEDSGTLDNIKNEAFQKAKAEIANYIFEETSVKQVFETKGNLNSSGDLARNFDETVRSESAVRLSGVTISDSYSIETNDSGLQVYKVWVLASISKDNLERERKRIMSELQRKLSLVDDNIKKASVYLENGDVINAVNSYLAAAISSTNVEERSDEFMLYISEAIKIIGNLNIDEAANPKSIDVNNGGTIMFAVAYNKNGEKRPVKGAKIDFSINNKGSVLSQYSISDGRGLADCRISRLAETRLDNILTARLDIDVISEIKNLDGGYKKYYETLSDNIGNIKTSANFSSFSGINRNLTAGVYAILDNSGEISEIFGLEPAAESLLMDKGYRVNKTPGLSLKALEKTDPSVLKELKSSGIDKVLIINLSPAGNPSFDNDLGRFVGRYSLSAVFLDTAYGSILSSGNITIMATSLTENGLINSLISSASKQLSKILK